MPCCYEEEGSNFPCPCVEEVPIASAGNDNLLDFIYYGPNQMSLNGSVVIDGEGTLREDDNLWGDFSLRAPLAFVFYEDWVFIPQDLSVIEGMDESLSEQINDALVEAEFNAEFRFSKIFFAIISGSGILSKSIRLSSLINLKSKLNLFS